MMMSGKHKHEKKSNAINRTTSETLRLGEAELRVLPPVNPQVNRKKIQNSSSSFQITGVSMVRTDGEDSDLDLDTDDISRVTDNETPSFSEDSRDTDEHQAEALAAAVVEAPLELQPGQSTDERFQVVKIPNTAPFTRGRWICVDYFDTPADRSFSKLESVATLPPVPEQDFAAPYYLMEQHINEATKTAGGANALSQGPSSISAISSGMSLVHIGDQDKTAQNNQKAATQTQPPIVHGQKDTLSDMKVALKLPPSNPGSAPNNNNIDRKIEEALDAVKTHLMVAVHKEVDFLKTRVSTLEGRVNELEIENSILRVNYLLFKS